MRKRKLDPKIIQVGDRVKVINPILVIRVGYPLCIDDCVGDVEKFFGNNVEDLIYSALNGDELIKNDKIELNNNIRKSRSFRRIIRELAYYRLKGKKFGGSERKLFTKVFEPIRNRIYSVTNVLMKRSGTYNSSSGGFDYWNGEYDYEPAYLSGGKSHKILVLNGSINVSPYNESYEKSIDLVEHLTSHLYRDIQIESINVEKIFDEGILDDGDEI